MRIAIVGATGLVGRELLRLLEDHPVAELYLYASKENTLTFRNAPHPVYPLTTPPPCDIAFFCTGESVSRLHVPLWTKKTTVIDLSSAFRTEFPLIIPEINAHAIKPPLLCSPNCTTTIMLTALYPIHRENPIKRIVASTYQAASGGGQKLLDKLLNETAGKAPPTYAFNLLQHPTEEPKLARETALILGEPIPITATCIRVPTLRVHALSLNVELTRPLTTPLTIDPTATPASVAHTHPIVIAKCNPDLTQPNTYNFWVLGDQLLKGAALNALQIHSTLNFLNTK